MNAYAVVTLGRPPLSGELRIGAVAGNQIEAWQASVLRLVAKQPHIRLERIYVHGSASSPRPASWQIYERLSSRGTGPFELLDGGAVLQEIPHSRTDLVDRNGQLSPDSIRLLEAGRFDVLLWFGQLPIGGDCSRVSRFGIWRVATGDPSQEQWRPPLFRQAYHRDAVSHLSILVHSTTFDEARVIYRSTDAPIEGWWFARNAKVLLDRAGVFLLRRLYDVLQFGRICLAETNLCPSIRCNLATPAYAPASVLARYLSRQVGRSLRLRFQRRGRSLQWFTAVRSNQETFTRYRDRFTGSDLHELKPNRGNSEADPFVIEHADGHFVFLEEVPAGSYRGRISFRRLGRDLTSTAAVPVLSPPYHISYPFLIRNGHQLFMIPETSEKRTVALYHCREFPQDWQIYKILVEGVALVDTTAFFQGDTWFFFTTSSETGELLLFYSDRLDGEWTYHPANPISTDIRNSRSAGALFRRGRMLIRPAQDGSRGYGHAITLNEVTALSRAHYDERVVETIYPNWSEGLLGTHTINASDDTEVIDVLRYQQ